MKRVVLYTNAAEERSAAARQFLRDRGVPFTELKLHEDVTPAGLQQLYPEARTFPVVVIDDFHVGSFEELKRHLNEDSHDGRKLLLEDE